MPVERITHIQKPGNLRDEAFSYLGYILNSNTIPETQIYWLENANDWMKPAVTSHLFLHLRDTKGFDINKDMVHHLVEEYLIFKSEELGVTL